jgi:pimeloyl-ACP methyl ester carboxylesterase
MRRFHSLENPMANDPRNEVLSVNDIELAFVSHGTGDAVLFVHGSVSDYRSWRDQIPFFAETNRAIAYSRRYHWPNQAPREGVAYAIDEHVADLIALIETLELAPVRLVGSSYGAMTSLSAATARPDLVRSLVLGEPPILPWLAQMPSGAPLVEAFTANAFEPARAAFARGDAEGGLRSFINGVIGDGAFDLLPHPARQMMLDNAAEMRAETMTPPEQYFPRLSPDDVRVLSMPVLLAEGGLSPAMFGLITDKLASVLPAAERIAIPAASHGMHNQNPAAYNEAVRAFQAGR